MVEHDKTSVEIDGTCGVHPSHKPQHIAVQTMAIFLCELGKVPEGMRTRRGRREGFIVASVIYADDVDAISSQQY